MGLGNVNEGLDSQWNIRLEVEPVLVFSWAEHEFVEACVLLFGNFLFVSGPDGFHEVDALSIDWNGEVNEVGVLVDDLVDVNWVSEVFMVFLQVENDSGTSFNFFVSLGNFKLAWTIWGPSVSLFALLSRNDLDLISDNKRWVKSDTELSDNAGLGILSSLFKIFNVLFWTALSNGSQIVDEVFSAHTDTIVLDDDLVFLLRDADFDVEAIIALALESLFFDCVWGVWEKLS